MQKRSKSAVALAFGALLLGSGPAALANADTQTTSNEPRGAQTMINQARASTLKVAGASLYYEVRGNGPVLLVIPGGPQDAGVFVGLAEVLADRYTVVTYDPRGNSRSRFDGDAAELDVDQQADDAAAIIEAVGAGPAYVFGTSGGAQIGLNLAARHPEFVHALVAHEPPSTMLLDNPEPYLQSDRDLRETYRTEGIEAAMAAFFAMAGLEGDEPDDAHSDGEMTPEAAKTAARVGANFEYWLAHGMIPLSTYKPDVAALKASTAPVAVAIGEESAGQPIDEMSRALASGLDVAPVIFPGDHFGFEKHTRAFAERLHQVFAGG